MKRQGPGRARIWRLGSAIVVMTLAAACSSSAAGHAGSTATQAAGRPGTHPAAAALDAQRAAYGSVVLGGSPGTPAANPGTGTLYVPIQCTNSFCRPDTSGHVVDVINTATCNAKVRWGCRVVAQATAGSSPAAKAPPSRLLVLQPPAGNFGP